MSVATGEVLDYAVKSLICHECIARNKMDKESDDLKGGMKLINILVKLTINDRQIQWKPMVQLKYFCDLLRSIN